MRVPGIKSISALAQKRLRIGAIGCKCAWGAKRAASEIGVECRINENAINYIIHGDYVSLIYKNLWYYIVSDCGLGNRLRLRCDNRPNMLGMVQDSHDGLASAERRGEMGIRIEVEDGEPIAAALRRFRKLIYAEGGYPLIYPCKWHKKNPRFYVKPSVLNRRRRWVRRVWKRGCGGYCQDWDYTWADDLCMRPRRSWGPMGRLVAT